MVLREVFKVSLKDLFIKEQSYIIEIDYLSGIYLYIEGLDKFGCAIDSDFNKNKLTNNLCIELHDNYDSEDSDSEVENYDIDLLDFNLETKIEDIVICHYFENNELKTRVLVEENN